MRRTPPGWYPDPADDVGSGYRWWDGTTWTDHVASHAYAPTPDDTGAAAPARQRGRTMRAVAWTVVVAMVLTTSAGALLLLWSGPQAAPQHPEDGAATAGGQLDARSRRASIGPVTMDLPSAPYQVVTGTHKVPQVLDVVFVAEATIHRRTYQHSRWTAMTCLASVDARLSDDVDLAAGAEATVRALAGEIYGSGATEVHDVDVFDRAVDGHGGVQITAQVRYQIAGLPSRYDDVTAILVRLDDGSVVAALSSVPDDASSQIHELAAESLGSLRVG